MLSGIIIAIFVAIVFNAIGLFDVVLHITKETSKFPAFALLFIFFALLFLEIFLIFVETKHIVFNWTIN